MQSGMRERTRMSGSRCNERAMCKVANTRRPLASCKWPRYGLSGLFAITASIALMLAYWRVSHEQRLREDEVLLRLHGRSTEITSVIPPLIRTLMGKRLASDFEFVAKCEVIEVTHRPNFVTRDVVAQLRNLRSLRAVRFRGFTIDAAGAAELSSLCLRTIDLRSCDVDLQAAENLERSSTIREVIIAAEKY
jgi:hypothetical protein